MDDREYKDKYANLRILKSVQQYLKNEDEASPALYPIRVPEELLYQTMDREGAENSRTIIGNFFLCVPRSPLRF